MPLVSVADQAKAVVLVIIVGIMSAIGFGLLPMRAAGGLKCEGALRGSEPKERFTEGYLVNREDEACDAKGKSRLTIVLLGSVLYVFLGIGAAVLPASNFERIAFGGEDPEDVYERN